MTVAVQIVDVSFFKMKEFILTSCTWMGSQQGSNS